VRQLERMSFIYNIFNCLNQDNKRFTNFFFLNFTLDSRNNSKRVSFRRNSNFPIVGFFFFFLVFVFLYVLKLVSCTFIYVKDGWKKKIYLTKHFLIFVDFIITEKNIPKR
jgi:hypothetical protein